MNSTAKKSSVFFFIKKMGRAKVDAFARLFVLPQANHGLGGTNYSVDGDGKSMPAKPIPNTYNRLALLQDWVEKMRRRRCL